ncbi:signal peptide peptidase SppA [Piscinibacter gummiphilus]|uniref:Signal peptide peptidase SppA n=1 Tax=Piscinibacter gummiphilus TaxID=946333 RepID=A0A1W6LGI4_9BURK|nr:signal peptide peptidase SppA [Piscinibacter gummiphilus]ARN23307.1 signal peptide peptidase SppA [Piscinibacter gummiphilus]ATU68008.1 signal peptide peptidase SppA [Piscinibacter gummiphilus]GLS97301.1 protease [Piscinibacter gummiphilus]
MPYPRLAATGRFFGRLWSVLDGTRRLVFNLLFLVLLVVLVVSMVRGGAAPMAERTTLVLNLRGKLVEQRSTRPRDAALAQFGAGRADADTQLRDVRTVLDAAAADPKVHNALLVLDEFEGGGLPALREAAAAIQRFRASGKKVTAWGGGYDQRQYYLAAQADEVFLHPMGTLLIQGFGGYRNYYREALDRVGVTVSLLRVGEFKDAGEAFIADGPSPESQAASRAVYDGLWATYTQDVEKARKLPAGTIGALIDDLPQRLAAAGGDAAKTALDAKLVDKLMTLDQVRDLMVERGAKSEDGKSFRQVAFAPYLARQVPKFTGDAIGVVVAEGAIVDGAAPAGAVGGLSTADLIRQARLDDKVKAVVLRVNSPGGSPYGSELIRRELELTKAAGKPVVISMGDVAASGGYWISMAADEVVADTATITGSIGVFALLPRADKALEKLGVHTDGVRTTWLVGAGDPRKPLDPRFAELLQSSIGHVYQQFTTLAAGARKTTPEKIDAVAQGRVWTGSQALERGLVDTIGGFDVALKSAAKRAKLEGDPRITYIEPERSRLDRVLSLVGGATATVVGEQLDARLPWVQPPAVAQQARDEMAWLVQLADGRNPFASLAHCLCTAY